MEMGCISIWRESQKVNAICFLEFSLLGGKQEMEEIIPLPSPGYFM